MPRILIVDDELQIRRTMKRQLGRVYGLENILEAENGRAALEQVRNEKPVLVILDIMMPVMDGITVCRTLRDNPENDGLYVIMLTGRDGGLPEGLGVGANVYLRKPFAMEELFAVVQRGIEESGRFGSMLARVMEQDLHYFHGVEVQNVFEQTAKESVFCVFVCNLEGVVAFANRTMVRYMGKDDPEALTSMNANGWFEGGIHPIIEKVFLKGTLRDISMGMTGRKGGCTVRVSGKLLRDTLVSRIGIWFAVP
ncbi:MAG: response regulator [Magnetococcales bacterium]|nr:response regulator [Magnetococcales bacterium]